jgi:hypothetical protein
VNQENATAFEPNNYILATAIESHHAFAFELRRGLGGVKRPGQTRIGDLDAFEPAAQQERFEAPSDGLDLG